MSIVQSPLLLGAEATGYQIQRSLRFNSSDSAYLSRTPASAGNRKTWTWSGWVKRSALSNNQQAIFSLGAYPANLFEIRFDSGEILQIDNTPNSATKNLELRTSAAFRDASAWYHIVFALDTTQSNTSDRGKLYVNGQQITAFSTGTYPSQNADLNMNTAVDTRIGNRADNGTLFSGYLADIHFIDGQALTPSSFAETNITTGQWVPKAYSGSYGTNGFQLKFADNSNNTAATLGKDTSGNSNNWTPNNLSVTAGAGNDSLVDTPTSYGTGNSGGDVRGNYATLNPLDKGSSVSLGNGNLEFSVSISQSARATLGISSGKWYWEVTASTVGGACIGISGPSDSLTTDLGDVGAQRGLRLATGAKTGSGTTAGTTSTFSGGDIAGLALNLDSGELTIYKNGVSLGVTHTGISGVLVPTLGMYTASASSLIVNFGQRPFAYTAPSGFKALCDTNLPAPTIAKGNTVMDVALYTGNGGTRTVSGLGFSPDFVWVKERNGTSTYAMWDQVRGASKLISSNVTAAEDTTNALSSFNSDGFTVVYPNTNDYYVNRNSQAYVAWCWDAGSSTVTNTQGSITSQVRANASAGFSIVTYTSPNNSSNQTVGHGLGAKPGLILVKNRITSYNWDIYHSSLGFNASLIFTTASTRSGAFGAEPTSTVFTTVNNYTHNSTDTYVAYCFAPVSGYSSFGSYTGNGSMDGPFVYTGFRPRWVMVKCSSTSGDGWITQDTQRSAQNPLLLMLGANNTGAEGSFGVDFTIDFLSNGFKPRTSGSWHNSSGATYIYAAFAENPFQYARAR